MRLRESRALLDVHLWAGAYYLAGYAVECGLKACVAKRTRRYEFPDLDRARDSWTHGLDELVKAAGMRGDLNTAVAASPAFAVNWTTVKDWTEVSRYDHLIGAAKARDLYRAIAGRNGVMTWVRHRW